MIATVNYVLIIGMGAKAIFHIITFHTYAYLQGNYYYSHFCKGEN